MTQPLTETESRVALLVSWGATNKQVADALDLRPKEVECELASVYRKLGVRSRDELPIVDGQRRRAVLAYGRIEQTRGESR